MDPLVRAAVVTQNLLGRVLGLSLSVGLAVVWIAVQAGRLSPNFLWLVLAALAVALAPRLRFQGRFGTGSVRRDLEWFTQCVLALRTVLLLAGPSVAETWSPVVYVVLMLAAAFARPAAAFGTLIYVLMLEAARIGATTPSLWLEKLGPQCVLAILFTSLNFVVFRAEIARVRRLSRERVESELLRNKEAARSYRLLTTPSSAVERTGPLALRGNEERAQSAAVEEIHAASQCALDLLRSALNLQSVVLLWLDASRQRLAIHELSTLRDDIKAGPFSARDGVMAAALSQLRPIAIHGARAARHVPYYTESTSIGAVCATPVLDRGQARGVLLVDREQSNAFSETEQELLQATARFLFRAIENERVFVQLEVAKNEQGKLYRAAGLLAAATTEGQVVESAVGCAREFTAFDVAIVTLFDRVAREHEICAASGENTQEFVGRRFAHNSGLVSMVVANRHPLPYRGDYDPIRQLVFERGIDMPALPSLLVLPLCVHDRALGTLILGSKRKGAFGESVRPILEVLASHMAVSLANARMLTRLEELATTDGLTGLMNRRTLLEFAAQKLRAARRFNKPVSVLICDIDHFKRVNDNYGHDIGDQVIKGFADALLRVKRDIDVVARIGGEEFVCLCEETTEQGGLQLAERIRAEVQGMLFATDKGDLQITASVGVATYNAAGQDWESLYKSADEALYASKHNGRNCATLWSPKLSGVAA
jgi:two-component system, cell cycle response regulator